MIETLLSILQISSAALRINNLEIPCNLKNELRNAALPLDLCSFFHSKYKWSVTTINSIICHVHSKANIHTVKKTSPSSSIDGIRPMPSWDKEGHDDMTAKCLICHHHDETNDHFLRCGNIYNQK